jgi:hypothetical protein
VSEAEADASMTQPTILAPDPELIKIVRLYLEKYEVLADEDRKMYRQLIVMIVNPPVIVNSAKLDPEEFERLVKQ